jgi:hypothetical protein
MDEKQPSSRAAHVLGPGDTMNARAVMAGRQAVNRTMQR